MSAPLASLLPRRAAGRLLLFALALPPLALALRPGPAAARAAGRLPLSPRPRPPRPRPPPPGGAPAPAPRPKDTAAAAPPRLAAEQDSLEALYKHLHSHPELSYKEERTAARLAK